jgi:hypothetical protein
VTFAHCPVTAGKIRPNGTGIARRPLCRAVSSQEVIMGRGILLWLLGVPIPIIILLALIWH